MVRRTSRLVAAVVLTAATGVVTTTSPASAAACSTSSGVSVVVDFHELGGGVQQVCDAAGAGKYAAAQFGDAGFALERVQRQPGFVCRVNGAPSDDACVNTPPADAYWGLWWSNGTSGPWTYSSQGIDSLRVPAGGSVALSWNGSSTKSPPGAAAPAHATASTSPSASPSSSPSSHPSTPGGGSAPDPGGSTGGSTTSGVSPSATPSASTETDPSAEPGGSKQHGDRAGDRAGDGARGTNAKKGNDAKRRQDGSDATSAPTPGATDSVSATAGDTTADPPVTRAGGLPTWAGPAAIGALFVAAGGIALLRRRRGTSGT